LSTALSVGGMQFIDIGKLEYTAVVHPPAQRFLGYVKPLCGIALAQAFVYKQVYGFFLFSAQPFCLIIFDAVLAH
jgi:hypothetical protein